MKKIHFKNDVAPHLIAILVFLVVTVLFFNPVFFDHMSLDQHDIQQARGSSKSIADYREATGQEALWAPSMFSGMPAYLVSLKWSDGPVSWVKRVGSLFLPHPINNIFLAFLCYYILLLSFGVRPFLAIAGGLAFGLSSYIIVGLGAGHNARIGAIAFMPLVVAGIHLAFSRRWLVGFAVTALGLALHLRENHLQITYYLVLIVVAYGIVQLVFAYREKQLKSFLQTLLVLVPAAVVAAATFFGQFWAITEYTRYSIRGPSELLRKGQTQVTDGLTKSYAFDYSDGILEPLTLFVPNFYGGSSSNFFVQDQKSETYQALVNSGNEQMSNQLANYTSAYWGAQGLTAPYYAGAIIIFLFVVGILVVDKKWKWWLLSLCALSIALSWGDNFAWFNYLMFDYFPGYNKFRSVTFALVIFLFSAPLLGMMGLEKVMQKELSAEMKKKLLVAFGIAGGFCLLLILFAGMGSYTRTGEGQLPAWFLKALQSDRRSLLRSDAFRSLAFITPIFILLYFNVRKLSEIGFYAFLIFLMGMDMSMVDKRYFTKDRFQRKRDNTFFAPNASDEVILKDTSHYRVYNLQGAWNEARTSYFHYSLGGYHGAKLKRYQDLYDSCISAETRQLMNDAQKGNLDFEKYRVLNMLNAKYLVYGPEATNVIPNPAANGNAWFVREVSLVHSPMEELNALHRVDTKTVAVIDQSKFKVDGALSAFDSTARIVQQAFSPLAITYTSQSASPGIGVFSEIYYPKGWHAFIDGKETDILRADYVLRALAIPAGQHTIKFTFEPKPYVIGNKITNVANWAVLIIAFGCIAWSVRSETSKPE